MASILRKITIRAPAQKVWDAMRDVGALHTRLVVGFVIDCRLENDTRIVTFGNGMTIRELIVDVSDEMRRVAWSASGGEIRHHNASAQVFSVDDHACEVVWVADLLPHEMAPSMAGMIEQGLAAMKRTLESAADRPEAQRSGWG
jgi:hypothetical protein